MVGYLFLPLRGSYQRWWAVIMSANRRDLNAELWMYMACEKFRVSEMGMRMGCRNFSARGKMRHNYSGRIFSFMFGVCEQEDLRILCLVPQEQCRFSQHYKLINRQRLPTSNKNHR